MPHKYDADRRHRLAKTRYKVMNCRAYEAGLQNRGSLTIWFTQEARSAAFALRASAVLSAEALSDLAAPRVPRVPRR
jgi:hypothetical protein